MTELGMALRTDFSNSFADFNFKDSDHLLGCLKMLIKANCYCRRCFDYLSYLFEYITTTAIIITTTSF